MSDETRKLYLVSKAAFTGLTQEERNELLVLIQTYKCAWPDCPGYPPDVPMHEIEPGPELHDACRALAETPWSTASSGEVLADLKTAADRAREPGSAELVSGAVEGGNTAEIGLPGDRGVRTVEIASLAESIAFGRVIHAYQRTHPDTLVRVTSTFTISRGRGTTTVRWWQRGTEMP